MPEIKRAVILAAGRGTRMGDITSEIPKPMVPIRGKPMLEHVLEQLQAAGIERFFIVIGYRRETIFDHFRNSRFEIEFGVQQTVNGTAKALGLARNFTTVSPFILTFGDIICDPRAYLDAIRILQGNADCKGVLGVRWVDDPWQGAAVYEQNGKIDSVIEKPPPGSSTTHWNSAGVYAFDPVIFDYLARVRPSARGEYEITSAFDDMLAHGCELRVSEITGTWRDVGRPEDLAAMAEDPANSGD